MAKSSDGFSIAFCYDDTLDSTDGVAQYVKTLGAWLSTNGHEVSYLVGQTKSTDWHGGLVHSLARNLSVKFNGNRLSMPVISSRSKIQKLVAEGEYDVIHVQVPYSPLMSQRVIRAASSKTAIIGTFHVAPKHRLSELGAKALRQLYGSSLKRFDQMLSVSPVAADFAGKTLGVESKVLPNVLELRRFSAARTVNEPERIVFLGRLVERKGAGQLLGAFNRLRLKIPNAKLTIAGDGPLRPKLERYVRNNRLEGQVEFLGFIDEDGKPDLLAKASIACFPSTGGESFGYVLVESMAAGSGVILAGDNPGYRGLLGKQPELLIDPNDQNLFADRLYRLLVDDDLRKQLHEWQLREVDRYDVEKVGPQIVAEYARAIAKVRQTSDN